MVGEKIAMDSGAWYEIDNEGEQKQETEEAQAVAPETVPVESPEAVSAPPEFMAAYEEAVPVVPPEVAAYESIRADTIEERRQAVLAAYNAETPPVEIVPDAAQEATQSLRVEMAAPETVVPEQMPEDATDKEESDRAVTARVERRMGLPGRFLKMVSPKQAARLAEKWKPQIEGEMHKEEEARERFEKLSPQGQRKALHRKTRLAREKDSPWISLNSETG
jgi:hypothetical protein